MSYHFLGPDSAHLGHSDRAVRATARRTQRVRDEPPVERRRPALLGLAGPLHPRRSRFRRAPPLPLHLHLHMSLHLLIPSSSIYCVFYSPPLNFISSAPANEHEGQIMQSRLEVSLEKFNW